MADQQVNVFRNRESYEAMFSALHDALKAKHALQEEVQRYREEETSADHALAALLASGSVKQTPFVIKRRWIGRDEEADIDATVFQGKGKAAVVFKIQNADPNQPWRMEEARLSSVSTGQRRAVAVRMTSPAIPPGTSGTVAIVVDGSAFKEAGALTDLMLEIYRDDGLRHAYVLLDHRLVGQ